jgi:hypothetical protein
MPIEIAVRQLGESSDKLNPVDQRKLADMAKEQVNEKRIAAFVALFFTTTSCNIAQAWNLFGYDNSDQCIKENISKVRFPDAQKLLASACVIGYGKLPNVEKAWVKAGKCIVGDVKQLYSMEKALSIINSCSSDSVTYRVYYNYLSAAENERRDAIIESARRRNYEATQTGPITIFDAQTGSMKICHQIGNTVNCF